MHISNLAWNAYFINVLLHRTCIFKLSCCDASMHSKACVCPAWDYTMPRSNSEKWICSKFFMSLRTVYEASYFGLYLDIQLSTGWFLRNISFVLTCTSSLLISPLPSCSTVCYLMTAAGLLSAMFNFCPSVSTTIPCTLVLGQLKNHNHQHTGPV